MLGFENQEKNQIILRISLRPLFLICKLDILLSSPSQISPKKHGKHASITAILYVVAYNLGAG